MTSHGVTRSNMGLGNILGKNKPEFLKITEANKATARKLAAARAANAAAIKARANAKAAENKARANAKAAENKARAQANALRKIQATMVNRNAEFKKLVKEFNAAWNTALGASNSEKRRRRLERLIPGRTRIVNAMRSTNLTASMRAERNNIAKHPNAHIHNYRLNTSGRLKVFTPWRSIIAHNMNSKRSRTSSPKRTYVPGPNRPPYHGKIPGVMNTANLARQLARMGL